MKKPLTHFCANPHCDLHKKMVPLEHDPFYMDAVVRYTFSVKVGGLVLHDYLCEDCYQAAHIQDFAQPEPTRLCNNPRCKYHDHSVAAGCSLVNLGYCMKESWMNAKTGKVEVKDHIVTRHMVNYQHPPNFDDFLYNKAPPLPLTYHLCDNCITAFKMVHEPSNI
jgi:hypothetical protein